MPYPDARIVARYGAGGAPEVVRLPQKHRGDLPELRYGPQVHPAVEGLRADGQHLLRHRGGTGRGEIF